MGMSAKGGASQACAACKYQRRKCAADCQLAPYFPADEQHQFQNAHRLFGVSNIVKILDRIEPGQRAEAMRSIKYEANTRHRYPVRGCLGVICTLYIQIQRAQVELQAVLAQLDAHRLGPGHHFQHLLPQGSASPPPPAPHPAPGNPFHATPSRLQLAMQSPPPKEDGSYPVSLFAVNDCGGGGGAFHGLDAVAMDAKHENEDPGLVVADDGMLQQQQQQQQWGLWNSFHESAPTNDINTADKYHSAAGVTSKPSMVVPSTPGDVPCAALAPEFDEISPYLDNIDDRQSYIDCKVHCASSSEESMKDTVQSREKISQNDLKTAAACFSLTSTVAD